MPNWQKIVQAKLGNCGLPPAQRTDVIRELVAHLEESYAQARLEGAADESAAERALEEVQDWQVLAEEITRAKSKEDFMNHPAMNYRTKIILLPAIAILFAVGLCLLFLDRAEILQRLIWTACMALLLWVAASEANRLNLRTRAVWLPGFVSLIVASLFLFAEEIVLAHDPSFYFTDPNWNRHVISGLPRWFYILWLLAQVLCGALGAFLSRRGGGTRIARIVAGTFPAVVMFLLCGLVIPVSAFFWEHNAFALSHPSRLAMGILIWAGAPAVAMLLGAAPFLRESTLQQA
jgi:hypothetical protein